MIDKITLRLPRGIDIGDRVERMNRTDEHTYYGAIGNMKITHTIGGLRIVGSIAKYLQGENITPLTRRQGVEAAIQKLEAATGLDLQAAELTGVECGASIILPEKPHEYLRQFGKAIRLKRNVIDTADGIETVNYYSETGTYKFTAYDKTKEAKKKRMPIPALFANKNVLRLEYAITKRRGIIHNFKRTLTAHDLYDHDIYRKLQALFYEAYKDIEKIGRNVFVDISKSITPSRLTELEAEKHRQSCPAEHEAYLQTLKESGALSAKSVERIRAKERKAGRDYTISDKHLLIAELDRRVKQTAFNGG